MPGEKIRDLPLNSAPSSDAFTYICDGVGGDGKVDKEGIISWIGELPIESIPSLTISKISDAGELSSLDAAPAGTLTGNTLASGVISSSLTSVGSLVTLRTGPIGNGVDYPGDPRFTYVSRHTGTASGSINVNTYKTNGSVADLNIDGGTNVFHDLEYSGTPGYAGVYQVYSLAGGNGLALGSNTFTGLNRNATYAPGSSEESNTSVRFELGPIWPRSEVARFNNAGDFLLGFQESSNFTASQSGTTVTSTTNQFTELSIGQFIAWSTSAGGTVPFVDRITGYTSATQVTVERSRTITSQPARLGFYRHELSSRISGQAAQFGQGTSYICAGPALINGAIFGGYSDTTYIGQNSTWDGSNWVKTLSGKSGTILMQEGGLYFYSEANDAGASLGSELLAVTSSGSTVTGNLSVTGSSIILSTSKTPASSTAPGIVGEICWDSSYIYICIATNTWKRTSLSSW